MELTSPPHIDTRGIEVRLVSWERLLEVREELSRIKEGLCQEDTGAKGIPLKMGCSLTLLILLQVYIVLTACTIQGLYLHQVVFAQLLHSN